MQVVATWHIHSISKMSVACVKEILILQATNIHDGPGNNADSDRWISRNDSTFPVLITCVVITLITFVNETFLTPWERAPTLKRVPTSYFWPNCLYRVKVYSNERPPRIELSTWSLRRAALNCIDADVANVVTFRW